MDLVDFGGSWWILVDLGGFLQNLVVLLDSCCFGGCLRILDDFGGFGGGVVGKGWGRQG